MSRLAGLLSNRLVLIGLAIGAFFAYDYYNRLFNFSPVDASVTNVRLTCTLIKRGYKKKTFTDELPCPTAEQAKQSNPKYKDFDIERKTYVTYDFAVDGKKYSGKHSQEKHENGKPIAVGDLLKIRYSNSDPSTTRRD